MQGSVVAIETTRAFMSNSKKSQKRRYLGEFWPYGVGGPLVRKVIEKCNFFLYFRKKIPT